MKVRPPLIEYYTPPRVSRTPLGYIISASSIFGAAFWLTGWATQYVALYVFFVDGRPGVSIPPWKLNDVFDANILEETLWGLCAVGVVTFVQFLLRSRGAALKPYWWLIALLLGIGYSWMRWLIWLLARWAHIAYPDSIDFVAAMALAVIAGLILVWWRNSVDAAASGEERS